MSERKIQKLFQRAVGHYQAGQLSQAEALYRQILAQEPKHAGALYDLGLIAYQTGRLDIAVDLIRKAIARQPNWPQAWNNLAIALGRKGQLDEAIAACRQAIALKPNFAEAYSNLGNALRYKGQLEEAIRAYRQATVLKPNYPEAFNNLGNALKDKGQLDQASAAYRQAIVLQPNYAQAHSNLIFTMHYDPGNDAGMIAQETGRWNRQHAEPLKKFIQPHGNDRDPDRRLRIGYVSPDFREHPVGRFLLALLAQHDKSQVEVFAYAQITVPDAMTQRLRSCIDGWRNIVALSDAQVADLIRQDQIDILVDLAMHSAQNRLLVFARKPAPVQVTNMAYPGTTGLQAIDYRISDPYLDPPGRSDANYSEQTVRLPDTFWCDGEMQRDIEVGPLAADAAGHVTFGCLNNFCKINEQVLQLWARVMNRISGSQLIMLAPAGDARQWVHEVFEKLGVTAQRVEFVSHQPRRLYLQTYHRIDIGLDTFPYNGHATSLDSFWMGVAVVTRVGRTVVGRAGWSQLSNLNLCELAAQDDDQFVSIAAELAADRPRLSALRLNLRARMQASALMDAPKFARNVEAAYRRMWRTWCGK
jgi:predicted O-linked N-acetylglucosamine transferase (SPINDLY family)